MIDSMLSQKEVSTHMPLARHDAVCRNCPTCTDVSTHMPLARHDEAVFKNQKLAIVSTHMPLARHDDLMNALLTIYCSFYSHASCEA